MIDSMDAMIATHDLGKRFDQFWAVDGIDLSVPAGWVLGLLGPNGAGKTTTVRMLTSILAPSRGTATVAGYDVIRQAQKVRASVGVLTEQHGLYGRMLAGEYLDFFAQLYGLEADFRKRRIQNLLESFGLAAESRRRIGEYSKGMRQKLALGRALLHDPPVLLLDEPTSAMDPESAHLVREAIRDLRSASRAIIICTHNLAEAEELSDQIAIIHHGRIVACGTPQELKQNLHGPAEYEVRFSLPLNGRPIELPSSTSLTSQGDDWLRYRTPNPEQANPQILTRLLSDGVPVLSLQEVPRSLEQVYLQVVQANANREALGENPAQPTSPFNETADLSRTQVRNIMPTGEDQQASETLNGDPEILSPLAHFQGWLPRWRHANGMALRRHEAVWLHHWRQASDIAHRQHAGPDRQREKAVWLHHWRQASDMAHRRHEAVWLVAWREVRDQFRDWRIILPILTLTLFFPALMNFTADRIVSFVHQYGAPLIAERLIPFLLMIVGFFPISVSLVIALESFVGERERLSIEPLLSAPLTDIQLYLGKLLASLVPPLLASYLGIGVYLAGVYWQIGWKASPLLLSQIVLLTTVQALVMVSGAVVISTQATSVRAANLLASFIVVPMALLIQGESAIMFWGRTNALWLAICGQLVIAVLLVRSGVAHFNREELLGRELDILNLGWIWRTFWQAFTGRASSLLDWYRNELPLTLRRMRFPTGLMAAVALAGLFIGNAQAQVFVLPPEALKWSGVNPGFTQSLQALRFFTPTGVGLIWLQNVRAILLATLLGLFSFGVLGVLVGMLPFVLIGYFMASLERAGMPPSSFLVAFVLPHGWVEIPAILLAGAAILRLGATLATPTPGLTIGEALLHVLADWARVMLALVLPLLLLAACLEAIVTPYFVARLLGG